MEANGEIIQKLDIIKSWIGSGDLGFSSERSIDDLLTLINQIEKLTETTTIQPDFKALIEAAKYGYEYHQTTQFPELDFETNCENNFKQKLNAQPTGTVRGEKSAEEIADKSTIPSSNEYVEKMNEYLTQSIKTRIDWEKLYVEYFNYAKSMRESFGTWPGPRNNIDWFKSRLSKGEEDNKD